MDDYLYFDGGDKKFEIPIPTSTEVGVRFGGMLFYVRVVRITNPPELRIVFDEHPGNITHPVTLLFEGTIEDLKTIDDLVQTRAMQLVVGNQRR